MGEAIISRGGPTTSVLQKIINGLSINRDNNTINLLFNSTVLSSCELRESLGSVLNENTIELDGVDPGTYYLKYEDGDGTISEYDNICELEVS